MSPRKAKASPVQAAPGWYVEIVDLLDRPMTVLGPYGSERIAERGESGVLRNLDHARFSTRIVQRGGA